MMLAIALAAAALDPIAFFRGRTHGEGTLKILFRPAQRITVDSEGRLAGDGTLRLKQTIHEGRKPPRTREWRMRQTAPGRFAGTLSDAAGPVRVEQIGPRIRIRYRDQDGLDFEQWLTQSGPRRVDSAMRVKRFGITVARVTEVIRKAD